MTTETGLAAQEWARLGRRLFDVTNAMVHEERSELAGAGFYAEALRRVVEGSRVFVTHEYVAGLLEAHNVVDKANLERAEKSLREAREQHAARLGTVRADIAAALRARAGRGQAGGKLRTDGVLLAAQWIDPQPAGQECRAARRAS